MTFEELWPTLMIPAEYDSMEEADQVRWRMVLRQAFEAGVRGTSWTDDHTAIRFIARQLYGRSTPYRMGLIAGEKGLHLPSPYSTEKASRQYREGMQTGRRLMYDPQAATAKALEEK